VGKRVVQPTIPTLTVDKNFTPTLARIQKPNFTAITAPPPDHLSAETHLTIGIACHEGGSLQKSTYHLRIAARAGLPTAMLLYALACRHGWGIAQDKPLALRCFEIAGSWGDGDALAEAGFCYAKGVGCRKDLKKAAEFYRAAEGQGIEMAGNSW